MSSFSTQSPVDGGALPSVSATDPKSLSAMLERARQAQSAWSELPLAARVKAIGRVKTRVLDRAEALSALIHREVGKPEVEAILGEVLPTADVIDYWNANLEEHLEPIEVEIDPIAYPGKSGVIERVARGVVAVIMPWNFPLALPFRALIPALLSGNAVLFKPSEVSPRVGAEIVNLFDGLLPDGLLQLVQGGGDVGAALCEAGADLVVFTGSVATGRKVARACAEALIPCALELGGKDAAIVLKDANLARAANGVVWGAMMNTGQNCGAVERVYVERAIADEFVKKVVEAAGSLVAGRDFGPLTTKNQCDIVKRQVDDAVAKGAKVLLGAKAGDDGYQFAMTVIEVDNDDLPLMADETFGPVLPIAIVATEEEAIGRANASRYGLTASIWTKDIKRAQKIARKLRAGVITINNHSFTGALPGAPWTGVGESGYGVTNSPFALDALTRPRFILEDRSGAKRELWWFPYTPALRAIGLSFAVMRSGSASIFAKVRAVFSLLGAFVKRWN